MRAEYTCVDGGGRQYVVTCETHRSIEDIKALASEAHKASIVDVVGEKSLGRPTGDGDGDDDEQDEDEDEEHDEEEEDEDE